MYTTFGTYYPYLVTVSGPGWVPRIISSNCCIHTAVPPNDGPRYARNM